MIVEFQKLLLFVLDSNLHLLEIIKEEGLNNEKVVTAGKNTKFGIDPKFIPEVKDLLNKYNLNLVGINQHIGSLFMDGQVYVDGVKALLNLAENFKDLEFIDLGGGFGVPYRNLNKGKW